MSFLYPMNEDKDLAVDPIACDDLSEPQPAQDAPSVSEAPSTNDSEGKMRVYNLIILDESGSMETIYQPALTGVNETLQTIREAQKEHDDQAHFVSLIAFGGRRYKQIYHNAPAEKAIDIASGQYRPFGGTPLYDTMGRAISELRTIAAKGDVVLVTVITDGYENASHEYSGKTIKGLVDEMKKEDWVFTYIGANQDVEAVAESLSIDNHLAFEANDMSTCSMFAHESRSRKKFFSKISHNMAKGSLSKGYFDEDDEDNDKF